MTLDCSNVPRGLRGGVLEVVQGGLLQDLVGGSLGVPLVRRRGETVVDVG